MLVSLCNHATGGRQERTNIQLQLRPGIKPRISTTKLYSTLGVANITTPLYFSLYVSERFIPHTNLEVKITKGKNAMCEHKEEQNMKGSLISNYLNL